MLLDKEKYYVKKTIIAGNWKMNKLQGEAKELFNGIKACAKQYSAEQLPIVVVAPTAFQLQQLKAKDANAVAET